MIELVGVSRTYRMGEHVVRALDDVDWQLPRGGYAVLMGPSGSGKSTLLNVIGCLDRPTAGTYRLDGTEVTGLPDAELTLLRRHKLGFDFQQFQLVPRLTAQRNVELPMAFSGVAASEQRARARAALDAVGLSPRADHRPDELSGGECQRVAIARALAMDPPVLLADEPTGNLDTKSGSEIVEILAQLHADGRTIVMVTHDERLARVGTTLVRLADGRIESETAT